MIVRACGQIILPLLLAFIAAAPTRGGDAAARITIRFPPDASTIELSGLPANMLGALRVHPPTANRWARILTIRVADQPDDAPTVLGAYQFAGGAITFTPRFPFRPGLTYRAAFHPEALPTTVLGKNEPTGPVSALLTPPARPQLPPTEIAAVYPSADVLPENLLKFYIHFTAPMSRGEAYDRIHILDVTDPAQPRELPREVPDAFLRLGEELWDARGERFTLLFDPGRIKRGLKPNEEVGAPLIAGRQYALVIDAKWRDANGQPLEQTFRKEFRVTPFDDNQPNPQDWLFAYPTPGTLEQLVLRFPDPLDHALLERTITVRDPAGQTVEGVVTLLQNDVVWAFTPAAPWRTGDYQLVIDPILEDLAGNSVGRKFETQTQAKVDQGTRSAPVTLPFQLKH